MMQMFFVLGVTLLSFWTTNAQNIYPGRCPVPTVQQKFDIAMYLGRWYSIQNVPAVFLKGKCGQATYTLLSDGTVKVLNQGLLADGAISTTEAIARVADQSDPAKLEVTFNEAFGPSPYWVLSTDYNSYALVYACRNSKLGLFYSELAWILSRERTLPAETLEGLKSILSSNGIGIQNLQVNDQKNCSRMPE